MTSFHIRPRSSHRLASLLASVLASVSATASPAVTSTPYPTAGGSGGEILTVTSLEDSGPGTLRAALQSSGPRIVRFAVAGEVWLKSGKILLNKPFITVEGQSAPSPGITLLGDGIRIRTHDVIFQNIRIRPGALKESSDAQNRDSLAIDGSQDGKDPGYNVLVENCSFSWAIDENVQIWGQNSHDIVVRNCIIAEGLSRAIHPKGAHSAGLIVGPNVHNVTVSGNLFAHNGFRNPVVSGGASAVLTNNLIYDPGFSAFHVYPFGKGESQKPTLITAVGNVLIAGPCSVNLKGPAAGKPRTRFTSFEKGVNPGSQVYYNDNLTIGVKGFDPEEKSGPDHTLTPAVSTPPVPFLGDITPIPSSQVEATVLSGAGARPTDRDETDKRIIEEVKNRTGKVRDWPADQRLKPAPAQK